jgi:ribonucleotide reductase alpha subunit
MALELQQRMDSSFVEPHPLLDVKPFFVQDGSCPLEKIKWVQQEIPELGNGKKHFVEAPETWSTRSISIAAIHYIAPSDHDSIRSLFQRVVNTLYDWLLQDGVFTPSSAKILRNELSYILLNRIGSFNSPVYYNIGLEEQPLLSACFINSVDDSMESITDLEKTEARIFQRGAGAGCNWSNLRSSYEQVRGMGKSSGPVSFMTALDTMASKIKSGGRKRRAARMDILNVDHPDIQAFIRDKADTEIMARQLVEQGWSTKMEDPRSIHNILPHQSTNVSVRLFDRFMEAALAGDEWPLTYRHKKGIHQKIDAKQLLRDIAQATWECGDPGFQFHDTINSWSLLQDIETINASNPCQPDFATVLTPEGIRTFAEVQEGSIIWSGKQWTKIIHKWRTGVKPVYRYHTKAGVFVGTENHKVVSQGNKIQVCEAKTIDAAPLPGGFTPFIEPSYTIELIDYAGDHPVWDITVEAEEHTYWTGGLLVSNCGEYVGVDNSSCNLASINVLPPNRDPLTFDELKHITRVFITCMDSICEHASYPTEKITANAQAYRALGLGWTNLGALAMYHGFPYDSPEARRMAAEIASVTTATAYDHSITLAKKTKSFHRADECHTGICTVFNRHYRAALQAFGPDNDVTEQWKHLVKQVEAREYPRNSAVTLSAPCGTIGFLMDSEMTGCEPGIGLRATKKLSYGGEMILVLRTVDIALQKLGYSQTQITAISEQIQKEGHVEGLVKDEHLPIFDMAFAAGPRQRAISPLGHLLMLEALQPHLSMSMSKTINLPNSATVEDMEDLIVQAWQRGIKCVSIFRDGSKAFQPLTTQKKEEKKEDVLQWGDRKRLPCTRNSITHKIEMSGTELYMTIGLFEDGMPGELFFVAGKHGATLAGLLDSFAIAVSHALQHGCSIQTLAEKFKGTRFAPEGWNEGQHYKSIVDYVAQWLENRFCAVEAPSKGNGHGKLKLTKDDHLIDLSKREVCSRCGDFTVPVGGSNCHLCPSCGSVSGGCG